MEEIEHTCCCVAFQIVCVLRTTDPAVVFATAEDPRPKKKFYTKLILSLKKSYIHFRISDF